MAFFANPPHHSVTAGEHLLRGEGAVFGRVPLTSQIGVESGQIRLPRKGNSPGTDRTTGSVAGSGMYRRLPVVALVALPPDFAFAAVRNLIRGQG